MYSNNLYFFYRSTLSDHQTTVPETLNFGYGNNNNAPPSIPRPSPVLRPAKLFSQGATGFSNDQFSVSRPSFITKAAPGSMSASIPKRSPQASHTAKNPETVLDTINIPNDVGLDVSQPKVVLLPELEDTAVEVPVVKPEAVENEKAEDPILQIKNEVVSL